MMMMVVRQCELSLTLMMMKAAAVVAALVSGGIESHADYHHATLPLSFVPALIDDVPCKRFFSV